MAKSYCFNILLSIIIYIRNIISLSTEASGPQQEQTGPEGRAEGARQELLRHVIPSRGQQLLSAPGPRAVSAPAQSPPDPPTQHDTPLRHSGLVADERSLRNTT